MRKTKFETGEYYHICNRGVDKREVFMGEKDYIRFLRSMRVLNTAEIIDSLYRQDQLRRKKETEFLRFAKANRRNSVSLAPLVELVCYCLNPNHYHFLVKQMQEKGIEKFMHKLGLGYTKYFNSRYNRSGSLFQGAYKAVEIESGWQLLYVSAYINGNPEIHRIAKADKYQWSSYQDYLGIRKGTLCNKDVILKEYKTIDDYRKYVSEVIKNSQEVKKELKKYSLE